MYLYIKITTFIKAVCLWEVQGHTERSCSWSDLACWGPGAVPHGVYRPLGGSAGR